LRSPRAPSPTLPVCGPILQNAPTHGEDSRSSGLDFFYCAGYGTANFQCFPSGGEEERYATVLIKDLMRHARLAVSRRRRRLSSRDWSIPPALQAPSCSTLTRELSGIFFDSLGKRHLPLKNFPPARDISQIPPPRAEFESAAVPNSSQFGALRYRYGTGGSAARAEPAPAGPRSGRRGVAIAGSRHACAARWRLC
jgi:hypothetical protein